MGSQLNMQATFLKSDHDSFEFPLIHAGATPIYSFPADARPPKRIRLATRAPPNVDTNISTDPRWREVASAQTPASSVQDHLTDYASSSAQTMPPSRAASPPPEQVKRGRRKKKRSPQPNQSDPFIHEHMPFPKHQPWLEVKPRQRKAAVEISGPAPVFPPESEAPDEGEALVLGKHADRIAALITQKRKDNDSKQFRQRMALQQRLHRGEKDEQDKFIAASHDELKRKMQLSAQGIFEENPPDGSELDFRTASRSSAESADDIEQGSFLSSGSSRQNTAFSGDIQQSPEISRSFDPASFDASEESEMDDGFEDAEAINSYDSQPPILGAYVHYSQREYYQHSVLTNRLSSLSNATSGVRHMESTYSPPSYATQYIDNSSNWNSAQPWTTQMIHALPSTQTPELERAEVIQARQQMASYDPFARGTNLHVMQSHDNYDYYASVPHSVSTTNSSSSSSTPAAGIAHMDYQAMLPSTSTPAADIEAPGQRTNMNIFTRQARENGVIGGNNNVIIPPAPRRNMFNRS